MVYFAAQLKQIMTDQVQATIITIGDELLIGQVIDTNSAFIAQQFNAIGVNVHQRIAVGDDARSIQDALDTAIEKSEALLILLPKTEIDNPPVPGFDSA